MENPAKASLSVIIPEAIKIIADEKKTNPGRRSSFASATIVNKTTARTIYPSVLIKMGMVYYCPIFWLSQVFLKESKLRLKFIPFKEKALNFWLKVAKKLPIS